MIDIPANTEKWFRTGSTYICDPPVEGTDYDIVLYVRPDIYGMYQEALVLDGWERGGSRGDRDEWASFKKRHTDGIVYNFLVTQNEDHYNNMYIATSAAKRLNLLNKNDRVMLFHAIVDGQVPITLEGERNAVEDHWF